MAYKKLKKNLLVLRNSRFKNLIFSRSVYGMYQLTVTNFNIRPASVRLTNNGHGFVLTPTFQLAQRATVQFGPQNGIRDTFVVHSVHIHWGENDIEGSEHAFNGVRFPGEVHIVCFNADFGKLVDLVPSMFSLNILFLV